tara:strand:- start:92892 stop:93326 length:435 start_codon:yes stop_codon:yes gene_type:complete
MVKKRKKSWTEKVEIAKNSYLRGRNHNSFAKIFYKNLFFLNPKIKNIFSDTDFEHQEKLLLIGLDHLFNYSENDNDAKKQILRLSKVHNAKGLNIHPHLYYYWIEALIMTIKETDNQYHNDLEFYLREVISFPVSFFISQYFLN